jgi:Tol biopolymer transport system component/tRNA A-37 threonylcarbamoyl transferase component Bud32
VPLYNPRTLPLSAGTKLGPYEVVSLVGSGGMGEVYKARDARLGRDVAIKILPASITNEGERLKRFEQEARAVAALNHPNILTIYGIETHDGSPYLVSELLEGETLQQRLREGALPVRKALDIAVQTAHGIAAAHEKGIVHRDLKPANIFITTDGRVKILDFGLAKLTQPDTQQTGADGQTVTRTNAMQAGPVTEEGVVLGTAGYMSPEQVRGKPADGRSDIFALGTILYEMLSGHRAFQRDSSADTMAAILKEDPPELSGEGKPIPTGIDRVVRHALEKNPNERFQSARDLAFDLESLSGGSTSTSSTAANAAIAAAAANAQSQATSMGKKLGAAIAGVALLSIGAAAGWLYTRSTWHPAPPKFARLTFRHGFSLAGRFMPDGQSIVYSAGWDGNPTDVYEQRVDSPESRSLGLPPDSEILSIAPSGEMAVNLNIKITGPFQNAGTLAEVAPSSSSPRELATDITFADWGPDGKQLAVVRLHNGSETVEFPIGKVLYETHTWAGDVRVAPDGQHVAFVDHPSPNDDAGSIAVVDLAGKKTTLTENFTSARGLAWCSSGTEVCFTATPSGSARALYGVTLGGRERVVASIPGSMNLFDVAKDGRVLFADGDERIDAAVTNVKDGSVRPSGWLDWSLVADISTDGKTVLFGESGEGAGANYGIYLRKADGSPAVRLGDGEPISLSPDGKWVAGLAGNANNGELLPMSIFPTGPGEVRTIAGSEGAQRFAAWTPDRKSVVFAKLEKDGKSRAYIAAIDGGAPKPVTPSGEDYLAVCRKTSPDGKSFYAVRSPGRVRVLFPIDGGAPQTIPGLVPQDFLITPSADGRSIYVSQRGDLKTGAPVFKVDLASGKRELVMTILPADRSGVQGFDTTTITPDGQTIAFSYTRILSTLYILRPSN